MKDIPSRVLLREGGRFHRRTSLYKLPVWQAKTEAQPLGGGEPSIWVRRNVGRPGRARSQQSAS